MVTTWRSDRPCMHQSQNTVLGITALAALFFETPLYETYAIWFIRWHESQTLGHSIYEACAQSKNASHVG